MDFVKALEDEIAAISLSLESDPRFLKLKELERLLALYTSDPLVNSIRASSAGKQNATAQTPGRKPTLARKAALHHAVEFLKTRGDAPTKTSEIFEFLTIKGIEIGGADPRNNLSALLHHSELFESHGRAGWTLKTRIEIPPFIPEHPFAPLAEYD